MQNGKIQLDKIRDYHDLANVVHDDIVAVALLVDIFSKQLTRQTYYNLCRTRLNKIEFDKILELKTSTIKDIVNVFSDRIEVFKLELENEDQDLNLFTMEDTE